MKLLAHPHFFNWLLIVLMLAAGVRNAVAGNQLQFGYWVFAAGLNVCVTLGMR